MKYMFQFCIIMAFCLLGELGHALLPFPVPASVYGLVLLFAALCMGIVKLPQVKETAGFLTGIFQILFIPAAAGVIDLWAEISGMLIPLVIAIIPVTLIVMGVSAMTVEKITGKTVDDHSADAAGKEVPHA